MQLTIKTSDRKKSLRLMGGTWFLGRSSENDIVIDEEGLGAIQANLTHTESGWKIVNLDPAARLMVAGAAVTSAILKAGDAVTLGPVTLEFQTDEQAAADAAVRPARADAVSSSGQSTILELEVAAGSRGWASKDRTLGVIADLTAVIAAGSDLEAVFDGTLALLERRFADRARRGLLATIGAIPSDADDLADLTVERSFDHRQPDNPVAFDMSRTLISRVLQSRRAVLSTDAATDSRLSSQSVASLGIHSVLAVPILFEERTLGVIYLDNGADASPFTRADLEIVALVAVAVGAMIENAGLARALARENNELKSRLAASSSFLTSSREMDNLVRDLARIAPSEASVLLVGESGTGKELAARTLHLQSPRHQGRFVAVNCAAIPETLIESELFGYAPSSGISGADPAGKPGKFELASGGTIFLDEIGDMALFTQAKLLRVLQEREVERLGATATIKVDVRVVSATNKDLLERVAESAFREDLYYRLNEIEIHIPPLRKRKEEILPLAAHFARVEIGSEVKFTPEAREILLSYPWPGNVRELKGSIRTACVLGNGKEITPKDLPERIRKGRSSLRYTLETLEQVERRHIIAVLGSLGGNKELASRTLGIARDTLYRKIRKYEIKDEELQDQTGGA